MANANAPATAKGRAMRERIVHAAAELIAAKGVAGMSLDDVRSRTGASRSQLYHYFENRDDLVHAVIDVITDVVLNNQGELLYDLDSWAGIDRWFDALVQYQIDRKGVWRLPDRRPRRSTRGTRPRRPSGACGRPEPLGSALARRPHPHESRWQAAQGRRPHLARHGDDGQHPGRPPTHSGPPRPSSAAHRAQRRAQQPSRRGP